MINSILDTRGLDRFAGRLQAELQLALTAAVTYLRDLCILIVARMGAIDTLALLLSVYISVYRFSDYDEAAERAAEAFQFNPTKWPDIRRVYGTDLELLPQVTIDRPDEAWMGVAAAHGIENEEGFTSFYGNEVPARPFVHDTATEGFPLVMRELQVALQRALQG